MTRIPVNMPGFAPNLPVSATKNAGSVKNTDFGQIFENQKNTGSVEERVETDTFEETAETSKEPVQKSSESEEIAEKTSQKAQEAPSMKENSKADNESASKEDESYSEEQMQLIMPMLQAAFDDMGKMVAEITGISPEELNALMENMGISETDLFDLDTLKALLLKAGGVDDMSVLLTDENLYSDMMKLEEGFAEIMENVQETLGLTDDEMSALKQQVENATISNEPGVTVETVVTESALSKQGQEQDNAFGENTPAFGMSGQNSFMQAVTVEQSSSFSLQTSSFISTETQNIMNQIMDYMNIQLNADTEVLEMQLQPESLGTLQIRISAKEGIMTAQFTTASESVKAALESQMVQLQQQLENQNIKVEAIEVTVQSHAFESALQQGEEKQQASEEKKNRTRAIDLNSIHEMDEIAEEDRILAEMMEANGNTVDYLA